MGAILAALGGHLGDFGSLFGCSRSTSRAILAALGASWGPPGAFLAPPWAASGRTSALPGTFQAPGGPPKALSNRPGALLGVTNPRNSRITTVFTTFRNIRANLCFFKHFVPLGRSWQPLGAILAALGGHLGDFGSLFGCSRSTSRAILAALGASWGPPGAFLAPPWAASG